MSEETKTKNNKKTKNWKIITTGFGTILLAIAYGIPDIYIEFMLNAVLTGEISISQFAFYMKVFNACCLVSVVWIMHFLGVFNNEDVEKYKEKADKTISTIENNKIESEDIEVDSPVLVKRKGNFLYTVQSKVIPGDILMKKQADGSLKEAK